VGARRLEDTASSPKSQGGKWPRAPREEDIIQLLDLQEIEERFGRSEYHVYRAVEQGRLKPYGRPGRQKYYSLAQLEEVFSGKDNGGSGKDPDVKPRYVQWPELKQDAA
jgi:hypothetical protein